RFLQLCGDNNMQVCIPTTPAQFFHMLRRQMIRLLRRPLIVMTPKSLLRHRASISPVSDLSQGAFHPVLDEVDALDRTAVKRIILCSGKVYFDLLEERTHRQQTDTAIIRIEQLYPFPQDHLETILNHYPNRHQVVWCQEEPRNQGSWHRIQNHLSRAVTSDQSLEYVSRQASAAPATGSYQQYLTEQKQLVSEALGAEPLSKAEQSEETQSNAS
ncbi:MAG: 2-oxoglutarate dehydrogenase E1 component, partial [Acidiferrobacteraceae bacterium]|nr:2-oxoglutarate dehydrogenase E1 component [Acidiferrobacteraceae bacterium]